LVGAARALGPRIATLADATERDRRLPGELVEALIETGLFTMLVPASLGGAELDLPTYVRAVEELARADASVAWCVGQASGLSALAAFLEPSVARAIFAGPSPPILANGPGEGNKPGCAVRVDGGYRISGRWNFASGCRHAGWLQAICQIQDAPEPNLRYMVFPIEQATFIDTWQVSGLRGTGSFSFTVTDLFVPADHATWAVPQNLREPGPLYLFSSSGIFGPSFGSVALGIAHSALNSFVELAQDKTPRGTSGTLRESPTVQVSVARAHAQLSAARLFLHDTLGEVWAEVARDGALSVDQQVRVRLAATNATHEAAAVVDAAYELAGSTAIFAERPFERRFRDVHAVTQQLQARASHFENVGRHLLGLEPNTTFL
jgi:alkylation response protein AidB-like acyl-CoA dehydrogenase